MKWFPPGLHAADNAQVVLVTPDASLEVVEQVPQLHADDETRHAQEDVTPQLQTSTVIRSDETGHAQEDVTPQLQTSTVIRSRTSAQQMTRLAMLRKM